MATKTKTRTTARRIFIECSTCRAQVRAPVTLNAEGVASSIAPEALADHDPGCAWAAKARPTAASTVPVKATLAKANGGTP